MMQVSLSIVYGTCPDIGTALSAEYSAELFAVSSHVLTGTRVRAKNFQLYLEMNARISPNTDKCEASLCGSCLRPG